MSLSLSTRFLVLDRESAEVRYEADCLCQAQGYADGADEPTVLAAVVSKRWAAHTKYQICVVDDGGQIVCRGPVVDVFDAVDLLFGLSLVLLPAVEGGAA